ncbi:hypothetical protein GWK36_10700 [Caldichromatium japonicum]|uniref:Uncharacterized protein n=1 Tax=Caldichromatium japonicum TaxID=2699430 RepID=A0A6G7VET7_9GAMM|nr:hypothetical protein GWK36_10700 [Caldichromatium japonicum]
MIEQAERRIERQRRVAGWSVEIFSCDSLGFQCIDAGISITAIYENVFEPR